jgi:hypothetical protein
MEITRVSEGGSMELDQWLMVYQTIVQSAAQRGRNRWSLLAGGAVAQSILLVATVFLLFVEPLPMTGEYFFLVVGLAALGLLTSLGWIASLRRLRIEVLHFESLARGIESQFAGGEFFRSIRRLAQGEKVCTSASNWTCGEWLPSVSKLPFLTRSLGGRPACLVAWPFVLGWIGLLVRMLIA